MMMMMLMMMTVVAALVAVMAVSSPNPRTVAESPSPGQPSPAQRVTPPRRTLTVAAGGDILTEGVVNTAAAAAALPGQRYDFTPLFAPMAEVVSGVDLAICYMETPIGAPGERAGVYGTTEYGTNKILSPFEVAAGLQHTGFDRCSTASNHSNDLGVGGIDTTLWAFDAVGLSHVGTARTPDEAAVSTFVVNGVRVAHLSYTRANNSVPPAGWRLNQGTVAGVSGDVAMARAAGAEIVIVSLHVQQEMLSQSTAADRQFVEHITAGGLIDLIVQHGPHVVQPVESVNGTVVYWSTGNMISGMGVAGRGRYEDLRTLDGLLATVRFDEQADGTWTATPWTVLLCTTVSGRRVYPGVTALADPALTSTTAQALQRCIDRSAPVVADLH
jgi:hypothetical protein